jgi:hypothetical protein
MTPVRLEFPIVEVQFEYSLSERDALREALTQRKEELGDGYKTLTYAMSRLVGGRRLNILLPDGTPIPSPHDLSGKTVRNFIKGRKTRAPTVAVIDAYLQIVEMSKPKQPPDLIAA